MKKRFAATGILVLLMIAVFAGIKYSEKLKTERQKREEEKKKIFSFDKDDVKAMMLSEGGSEAVLVKKGDKWFLEEPVSSLADDMRVKNLLDLVDLKYVTKISKPDDPAKYGFGKGEEKITFVTKNEDEFTLVAGGERPVGGGCFVKVQGSDPIYAVVEDVKVTITAKRKDLFERDVLPLYPADLSGLSVKVKGKRIDLVKKDGSWYLGDESVDRESVDDFVREICFLNATDIYGGKKPKKVKIEASFRSEKEKSVVDVRIYEPVKGENGVAVQVGDRVEVLMIPEKRFEKLTEKYDKFVEALEKALKKREEKKKKQAEKKQKSKGENNKEKEK